MKFFIFLAFSVASFKCNNKDSCLKLIPTIFSEDFIYVPKRAMLNLTAVDTITILDTKGYLKSLQCKNNGSFFVDSILLNKGANYKLLNGVAELTKMHTKIYNIKNEDELPTGILKVGANTKEEFEIPKYNGYFILNNLYTTGDTLYLEMEKIITRDRIGIWYLKRNDNNWILLDKLIGKY